MTGAHPVLGVSLRLTTTSEGGRTRGLGPFADAVLDYRPNWGFRGLDHPHEQAGAPILVWERDRVELGETVRAVIIPMSPETWADLEAGDELVMYEGSRVCGRATVVWRDTTAAWPVNAEDLPRFRKWAKAGSE